MNKLEILQQINMLTSALLSTDADNCYTLKRYIDEHYIPFQKNAKKERNFKCLLGKLRIISSYDFSNKRIEDINENDIVNFLNLLKIDRDISQATHNRYRACLNHIFNSAIKDKLLLSNPVKYTQKYKEKSRDRVLSQGEISALLESCKLSSNVELYYIVLVALYTGMRYSNIINMMKSKLHNNLYLLDADETKSGKEQVICLHQDLLDELNIFMNQYDNGDFIFKSKEIKRSFKNALNSAGIKHFRFHDLRRTFATTLLYNNTNIKVIQNMLGHSSVLMTERYLANDLKKELDAVNKLCFIKFKEKNKEG